MRPISLLNRIRGGLVRDAVLAVGMRMVAVVLSFLFTLIVSRTLSIDQAGSFFFVFAAITIAANFGKGGLAQIGMRAMARAQRTATRYSVAVRVLRLALLYAVLASLVLALFLSLQRGEIVVSRLAIALAAATTFSLALTPVLAFLIRGLGDIIGGITFEMSIFYGVTVILVVVLGTRQGWESALGATAMAGALALVAAGSWLLKKLRTRTERKEFQEIHDEEKMPTTRELIRSSRTLLVLIGVNILSTWFPQIALGLRAGEGETALYAVALRVALLISLILSAMNVVVAPRFARLSQSGDMQRLRNTYHRTVQLTLFLTLPLFVAGILFPAPILGLFGADYVQAVPALLILMAGQLINVATGSVGNLLIMSDLEHVLTRIVTATGLGSVILSYMVAGIWGHVGVAAATATFLAIQNVVALIAANRIYGLYRFSSE